MSEVLASYSFLPWLRLGVGAEISRVDGGGAAEKRHKVSVELRFNQDDTKKGALDLELFGPGEVRGFDVRCISRKFPRVGVMDAEPNYFPLIEFDQPDLPWRYTPAKATNGDRLTPWITLIVLADDEVDGVVAPEGRAFGQVKIKDAAVLPKHGQLWAWAHVQVAGESGADAARVAQLLDTDPDRVISRIMSPRRLLPKQAYTAFLVPTFQRGVVAGMAQDPPDALDGLTPAWTDATNGALTLPVYFQWRFGTGVTGDFESLARLIKGYETPPNVGVRDMDVSAPQPGAPPAHDAPLGMLGMLRGIDTPETNWTSPQPVRAAWITWLKELLNRPADRLEAQNQPREVTPPLYGQWHAATDRCNADAASPRPLWFQDLSVDPRLRVAAALGTQVVQNDQEALMASAWQQVDRIRQLNEELRQAQLARAVATRLMDRHILTGSNESILHLTSPLFARVKASPTTIRAVLDRSPIPRGVFEGAFRRIARPLGPIARRQERTTTPARGVLERLNSGQLSAAATPKTPDRMSTPMHDGAKLAPSGETVASVAARRKRARWLYIVALILLLLALLLAGFGLLALAGLVAVVAVASAVAAWVSSRSATELAPRVAFREGKLTGDLLRQAAIATAYHPAESPLGAMPRTLPVASSGATVPSAVVAARMQETMSKLFDRVAAPTDGPRLTSVSVAALSDKLAVALQPARTIGHAYKDRFKLTGVQWEPDDPIEPIMAAPTFPQPMYAELKKISVDWLLPGFSEIPTNISTLVLSSGKMIEAFMVGLNHEMARELLWREYPTDQRGTYFRQFWDVAGFVPQPGETIDTEKLTDIVPIHTWKRPSALGSHSPRPPAPGSDYLVLLVRGDLLRRYPLTVVYAARAKWVNGKREIDDPAPDATPAEVAALQSWPLFSGTLEPDGTFYGFRLTVPQVKGSGRSNGDPGWFFVLQEHSDEPRFGLDEADPAQLGAPVTGSDWNGISWGSLAADAGALSALKTVDLDAQLPDTTQVNDPTTRRWHADQGLGDKASRSSDLAYITFQRPMRVGIHAEDMIK